MSLPDPIPEDEIMARLRSAARDSSKNPLAYARGAFGNLQTSEDKAKFWTIIGLLAGAAAAWLIVSLILAVFPWWMIVLAAAGLAGYVYFRTWKIEQRKMMIEAGFCGQCGYDLRGSPTVCPECGRDARLDEPAWRKLKREHAERAKMLEKLSRPPPADAAPKPVIPIAAAAVPKPVFRPPVDLAPIPVEGDE